MRKSKSLLLSLIVAAGLTTLMGANVFADSSLKELTVNGKTDSGDSTVVNLSPSFSEDVTDYEATVKNSVKKLDINAVATESSADVKVSWDTLDEGDNKTYVEVTDSNGQKTTYTIKTKRLTTDEEETYKEDTNTKKDSGIKVTVNKTELTISSKIKKSDIPEGFEESTFTYNKKEVPCIVGKVKQLTAVYMTNEEEGIAGFYIYNEKKDTFYPMRNILIKSRMYTVVRPEKRDSCLNNYTKKRITIYDQEVSAWELDSEEKLYLVYAMNWDGDINLYCYDDQEKVFQRYIATNDVNTQLEAANTSYGKLQDKYNSIVDRYNILVKAIAGLIILIVILIFAVLNLILSNKTKKVKKSKDEEINNFGINVEGQDDDVKSDDSENEENPETTDSDDTTEETHEKTEEDEIEEAISEVNEDLKLAVAMETGIFDDTDEQNEDNDADNGINILEETNEIEENENSILMENEKDIQTESDKKDSTVKLDDDDDDDFVFVD